MLKRINHNDLIPWFTRDHRDLPDSYLKECREFFKELRAASRKQQAASGMQQVTAAPEYDIIKTERKK